MDVRTLLHAAPPMAASAQGIQTRSLRLWWIILTVSAVLPFAVVQFPPLYDYYHWVFVGHLVPLLLPGAQGGGPAVNQLYGLTWLPIPNLGEPVLIALLGLVLPADVAGRVFLTLCVLAFAYGFASLVRAVQGRRTAIELLGFPVAFGYFMYKGYDSYLLSLAIAFFAVSTLHRVTLGGTLRLAGREVALLAGLGVGLYLCHLFGWMVFALATAIYTLRMLRQGQWRAGLLLGATVLPALALLGWYTAGSADGSQVVLYPLLSEKLLSLVEPLMLFLRTDPFTPPLATFWTNLGGGLLILAVLAANLVSPLRKQPWLPLLLTAAILGVIALALPISEFSGDIRPDERFVLPAVLIGLASLRFKPLTVRRGAAMSAVVLLILSYHLVEYQSAGAALREIKQSTAAALPPGAAVLSLTVNGGATRGTCAASADVFSVGAPTLKWFGLERLLGAGATLSANVMPTSLVHAKIGAQPVPDLTVVEMSPDQIRAAGPLGLQSAGLYPYVEVFGCPQDIDTARAAFTPQYETVASRRYYAGLGRRPTP
jgi:hypothetical protein